MFKSKRIEDTGVDENRYRYIWHIFRAQKNMPYIQFRVSIQRMTHIEDTWKYVVNIGGHGRKP